MTVILPREPEELDPRYVGDPYGLKLSRLLFASLVEIDPENLAPRPSLAASIEQTSPIDYRVELVAGSRFADGTALDAEDVVATFRALQDGRVKSRYESTYARIARVWAEGATVVRFRLTEPHAPFLTDLEMPVLRAEDAFVPRAAGRLPVASGPYVLAHQTSSEIVLTPNPRWAPRVPSRPVRFVVIRDDNTRALRMLGGAGDLALNSLSPLLLPLFDGKPQFHLLRAPGISTTYVGLNLSDPRFADRRVREALLLAIDRRRLLDYKLGARGELARGFVPPGHWAFAADIPLAAFDPVRARALLDEAGFPAAANGQRFSLTLRTSADRFVGSLARALSAMWRDVGVEVEIRPSEGATLLADLARGRFQLTFLQLPELIEPHVLSWFFGSERIPLPGVREGGNRWHFISPELDRVLERGREQSDRTERAAAYRQAQHILARELPVLPLWHEAVVAVTSRALAGYAVPRDARFLSLRDSTLRRR